MGLDKPSLLTDPQVRRWHDNLAQGSAATADVWLRRLRAFFLQTGETPSSLLRHNPNQLQAIFLDFVKAEQERGSSGPYISHTIKVARSWLRFNAVDPPMSLKVRGADRVHEETALTRDELRSVLNEANPRERVAVVLMAQSGVRPEVLGNYLGTDGLRIRDLPEMQISGTTVSFARVPTMIGVRPELSKAGHRYVTWLGSEGTSLLKDYLEARLRGGEKIQGESSLIRPERANKPFIRTLNVGDSIRHALLKAGFRKRKGRGSEGARPYLLRTTFATRLLECENDGLVSHTFAVHWLGHKGDMTATYTTNRGKLPPSTVEQMRDSYRRCEPRLSTIPTVAERDEGDLRLLRIILKGFGVNDRDLKEVDLSELLRNDEKLKELVRHKGSAAPRALAQRVVSIDEMRGLLAAGWSAVMPAGDQFIVQSPRVEPSGGGRTEEKG